MSLVEERDAVTSVPRLAGRVAIITGASRGIGAAVARRFTAEGARVVLAHSASSQRTDEVQRLEQELTAGGAEVASVSADLRAPESAAQIIGRAREAFGGVDILINNAAYSPRSGWDTTPVSEWNDVLDVNVRAGWLLAREAYPELRRSPHSAIVNVSSVLAQTGGVAGAMHYTTSKAAVIGITRAMARELGVDGIRVNAVMPGAIRTEDEIERETAGEIHGWGILDQQAIKRRGYAEDVAGAFLFLVSDDSSFITGQVLNVDGGWVHY